MENEQQQFIHEFVRLLKTTPDDAKEIHKVLDFFILVLRHKKTVLPVTEFVTVLKRHKPILFCSLSKSVTRTSPIYFILQLETDYEMAVDKLGIRGQLE